MVEKKQEFSSHATEEQSQDLTKNTSILDLIDEQFWSKAWFQLAQIIFMTIMYVIDIFSDLYFCFVDVRIQYEKFITEEYETKFNKTHPKGRHSQEQIANYRLMEDCGKFLPKPKKSYYFDEDDDDAGYPNCGEIFTLGFFPNKSNCYSGIFYASLGVIIGAYLVYNIASLYIIFVSNDRDLDEFRLKIRGAPAVYKEDEKGNIKFDKTGKAIIIRDAIEPIPKHQAKFALLTIFGIGPNYFIWEDLKTKWKLLDPDRTHDWKWKLNQKTVVLLDAYIHTLHLIHTSYEDLPLLYLYIYIAIHETQYFIKESITFYPTIISSLYSFCQDYSSWVNAVTTPKLQNKTDREA